MPPRLTALALGIALAAPAMAQDQGGAGLLFSRMDADGNGEISTGELAGQRGRQFRRLDGDGDARVTLDELAAAEARLARFAALSRVAPEDRLRAQDRDGDGGLSEAEFTAIPRAFPMIDADGNGAISRAEFDRLLDILSR
jgi:Ca2+-binding EF-hand superfamily protein